MKRPWHLHSWKEVFRTRLNKSSGSIRWPCFGSGSSQRAGLCFVLFFFLVCWLLFLRMTRLNEEICRSCLIGSCFKQVLCGLYLPIIYFFSVSKHCTRHKLCF